MKKTKETRIILINPSKAFSTFKKICEERKIEHDVIDSFECVLVLSSRNEHFLLHKNKKVPTLGTYFLIRGWGNKVADQYFLSVICEYLHNLGVPYTSEINRAHSRASAKITQMVKLLFAGVEAPQSILCRKEGFIQNKETIIGKISFPCVLKIGGANGKAVWKIENERNLEEKINTLEAELGPENQEVFLIQEYIPNNYDIRVIVFQNAVIGAMKRISSNGFHNNISRGGSAKVATLTTEEEEIAVKACEAVDLDFGGVDIVRSERGPLVLEVNRKPGILGKQGFVSTTGIDVVQEILSILTDKDR